jgi:hypothetical protein
MHRDKLALAYRVRYEQAAARRIACDFMGNLLSCTAWPLGLLHRRCKCTGCAGRPIDVRRDWTLYRAAGNGCL